jgi:hypothetical protein
VSKLALSLSHRRMSVPKLLIEQQFYFGALVDVSPGNDET